MPLLSIIIPSFNALNSLRNCIDSIQCQTFHDYEVWIMDGQSTDGTVEFLKSLQAPFYWQSETDNGIYDAMNKGIELSKGEWLYFLGSDDRLNDDTTLEKIFFGINSPEIKLLIGNIRYDFQDSDSFLIKKSNGVFRPEWSKKMWLKNTVHHQGVFYKKEVFNNQVYNLKYKILADYDLHLKLFHANTEVKLLNQIIAVCKTGGISKTYNWPLYREEVKLKTQQSHVLLKPLFYVLAIGKFLLKKI